MSRVMSGLVPLLGRVLMSFIFIGSGWGKLMTAGPSIQYMASQGLPAPEAAYGVAVLCELGGGLLILFGLQTRAAALVLALFCVATAFIAHLHPGDMMQMINFMKNICMAGGFLQLVAWGAGSWSLDAVVGARRVPRAA
jgi:putative oxidoreductase